MGESAGVSYQPTPGHTFDPAEARYWEHSALEPEITRVFEICHGCRMCFKYCDTFPSLFALIDQRDGDVRQVTARETEALMDSCFQCKQCEVQCPYTPRDHHPFQVDFPRLVHRHQALATRARGLGLRDGMLADPDRVGRWARASLGVANWLNRARVFRRALEWLLTIHREKLLPPFAAQTFERWARRAGRLADSRPVEAVLFPTCYVQNNEPEIGRDAMFVLEKNGVDCRVPPGLACCGMPAWEHGDHALVGARARANLDILLPHVERGAVVLPINPTCSLMLRRELPGLLLGEDRARAERVAAAVRDPCEYLWSIREEPRARTPFLSTPGGRVAYHAPCHLRAQAIGFRGRDLLRRIPGVEVASVFECSGHDGSHSMKTEGYEASRRAGARSFADMREAQAQHWASECPLSCLQFEQHAGVKAQHPLSLLAMAYRTPGDGGFPEPAPADPGELSP